MKYAWNLEEIWCDTYGLADAIRWFKKNMPDQVTTGCILKNAHPDNINLHLCYYQKRPLLSGAFTHRIIYTMRIDDDLARQFCNKNMLILQ